MSVTIKSEREIELIRKSCHIIAKIHQDLGKELKAGMSTLEVDSLAEDMIRSYGCVPNFKNYGGFPGSVCVSINNEVVHGIPSAKRIIQEGDIVSLDMGCIYKGYHSDAARTHAIGEVSEEARLLIERTRQSFFEGIKYAKAGNHLHQISNAIGAYCEKFGYGVVRGIRLRPGMTLAIEPMVNAGRYDVEWTDDDWTVITEDGSLSAHYENTILITDGEPEILTLTEDERVLMQNGGLGCE